MTEISRVIIREPVTSDADDCARIGYEGFRAVNERYGYPPNFPSVNIVRQRIGNFIQHPMIFGVVAECAGRVVGFNFLSERDPIRAIGPIVVDPAVHHQGIGRRLMQTVLERARGAQSVRLLQETFNMQSLSLYAALGFDAKELMVVLEGEPKTAPLAGWEIRPLTDADVLGCEKLHERVHGYRRTNELRDAVATGTPVGAFQGGRLRAYLAAPTIWQANHGVGEADEDMQALIIGTARIVEQPLSFLVPVRQASFFRWCLAQGLRATRPMTLMSIGEYRQPQGNYSPSVLY